MKKYFLLLIALLITQYAFSQTNSSVLAQGDWYKFSVDTTGVFKIDKNLLQRIGISTNGLNPKNIQIFGNGGHLLPVLNSDFRNEDLKENAIYVEGEADGSFDANDFILFYAKGPHDWVLNSSLKTAKHRQNIYSDKGYYFITVGGVSGKRVANKTTNTEAASTQITSFDDFTFYEKEEYNLLGAGTQWFFYDNLNVENVQTFKIPFVNAVINSPISLRVRAVSTSVVSSSIEVKVNGQDFPTLNFMPTSTSDKARTSERTGPIDNSLGFIEIELNYDNNGNPSAETYLDFWAKEFGCNREAIFFQKF